MNKLTKYLDKILLALIMALTGFLTFYAIGSEGYSNQYYSAAVKSMLTSWHNFFYASFDPGGFVTVDKPAFGLWLQAASAFLFGFHGWSLILPEALSAVISTAVLYHLVKRYFGSAAGLVSALVLGLTPILIAVARTNNLDSSLILVLLLSSWALIKASENGSLKLLLLSVALVGIGFNIKMLQAFMIIPAIYLTYYFTAPLKPLKKLSRLACATALLLVVSLSWALIVDLTPADSRPYIGSSTKNSVFELALGYNGIQRLTGERASGGQVKIPSQENSAPNTSEGNTSQNAPANFPIPSDNSSGTSNGSSSNSNGTSSNNSTARSITAAGKNTFNNSNPEGYNRGSYGGFYPGGPYPGFNGMFNAGLNGGPGGIGENGPKSLLRLFNRNLSGQISWFLPLALFGILILSLEAYRKETANRLKITRYLVFWSSWIIPMMLFFCIAGFYHRYYLSMLAPGIAALSGIAAVELWKAYNGTDWKWALLPSAILATAATQWLILSRYYGWSWLIIIVCSISMIASAILTAYHFMKRENFRAFTGFSAAAAVAALLIAPAIWSYTPIIYGLQTTLPYAGPDIETGSRFVRNPGSFSHNPDSFAYNPGSLGRKGNMPGGAMPEGGQIPSENRAAEGRAFSPMDRNTVSDQLINFLLSNKKNEKYLVVVQDANTAAPIILQTGDAVMALGGFSGNDRILTPDKFIELAEKGEIRYILISSRGMEQQAGILNWVKANGREVNWGDGSAAGGETLYDLSQFKR